MSTNIVKKPVKVSIGNVTKCVYDSIPMEKKRSVASSIVRKGLNINTNSLLLLEAIVIEARSQGRPLEIYRVDIFGNMMPVSIEEVRKTVQETLL